MVSLGSLSYPLDSGATLSRASADMWTRYVAVNAILMLLAPINDMYFSNLAEKPFEAIQNEYFHHTSHRRIDMEICESACDLSL